MKRFAVAFFVMALFLSNLAAEAASATFATRRGEIFQLILDGRLVNGPGSSQVRMDRLPAGAHNVEFRVPARRGYLTYCARIFLERGFETNYILIPPGYTPSFLLKKVGQVRLTPPPVCNTCPRPNMHYNGNDVYDDYDYYNGNSGSNYNQNGSYGNNYKSGSNGNGYNNSPNYSNNYNGNAGGFNAPAQAYLSRSDVDQLVETIRKKSFESSKLEIAKQALTITTILAEDAKKITSVFGFESTRLDFAKFVYPRIYDQQNFYRVYDAFEFETSITEMQAWLKR
jgi:hypothetical protein